MFRHIIDIAWMFLYATYRQPSVLIFQFALPLIFTFLIGQATGGSGPTSSSTTVVWQLAVVNEDSGALGERLVDLIERDPTLEVVMQDRETAVTAVTDGDLIAVVTIPASFSDDLMAGDDLSLDFYSDPDDTRLVQPIEQVVLSSVSQLDGMITTATMSTELAQAGGFLAEGGEETAVYFTQSLDEAIDAWENPPVIMQVNEDEIITTSTIPDGIDQSSPGMMAMFATFGMIGGAAVLVQERQGGTLRRLVVMPVRKSSIILGKMSGILVTGIAQMIILIVAGALLFDVAWGSAPIALALMVVAFALAITSLGMMMAALAKTAAQISALSTIIVLSISALGGAWWPLEIVPGWMQIIGRFSPISWAMDGFHDVITRGFSTTAVLPEVGVLLLFTAVFLTIGIGRFRYE